MSNTESKAAEKWNKLDKEIRRKIIENTFCSACGVTKIVDYSLHENKYGLTLKGRCDKCGKSVARSVEID